MTWIMALLHEVELRDQGDKLGRHWIPPTAAGKSISVLSKHRAVTATAASWQALQPPDQNLCSMQGAACW